MLLYYVQGKASQVICPRDKRVPVTYRLSYHYTNCVSPISKTWNSIFPQVPQNTTQEGGLLSVPRNLLLDCGIVLLV